MNNYLRKVLKQENFLGTEKKGYYFEGWYFKVTTSDRKHTIALIPGITKGEDAHAFIQVIDNIKGKSYYFRYELEAFSYSNEPFSIKIENNLFSLTKIILDIKDIKLKGEICFKELLPIHKTLYSPNIMGPFAYLSFMECNHSVISLGHTTTGKFTIYNKKISFNHGTGYIEKDYGSSFPKRYIWLQANSEKKNTNIFLSIATIPFKFLTFTGVIGILMVEGKEYRFATYNRAKLFNIKKIDNEVYGIKIMQGNLVLEIELTSGKEIALVSPNKGRMNASVKESLNSIVTVKLTKKNKLVFESVFNPCTSEIFW